MKRGTAELPLHRGSAPAWLFSRMRRLVRAITEIVVALYGAEEFLNRISDPVWFQSLGCVAGFDWHSSGLTTTLCAALKEGVSGFEKDLGLFVTGGKGRASRKTPKEIEDYFERFSIDTLPSSLEYASRMVAKVDSAGLQDGYQLYHHTFLFTKNGTWAVVQQGMNPKNRLARRYHWHSEGLGTFVVDPHKAILCEARGCVLNMVTMKSMEAQKVSVELAREEPAKTMRELKKIKNLVLPSRHPVSLADINEKRIERILVKTYENPPHDFASLLSMSGIGEKTIRALALISEIMHGASPSFEDPVSYSFAHGGKDGYPYPIDRKQYDSSVEFLEKAIQEARLNKREKVEALKRLSSW